MTAITTGEILFWSGVFGMLVMGVLTAGTVSWLHRRRRQLDAGFRQEYSD